MLIFLKPAGSLILHNKFIFAVIHLIIKELFAIYNTFMDSCHAKRMNGPAAPLPCGAW